MSLIELAERIERENAQSGYVGIDFRMAVLCIIAQRTGYKVKFPDGGVPYDEKLAYWARKRHFGECWFDNKEALLKAAFKRYGK